MKITKDLSKMSNLKIYAFFLCTVIISACSSDDEETFNTGAATVGFQETAMTVKESAGLCTVPVVVTGEHNGNIRVTIQLEDKNAKEDENYIITTKTLVIPAGQETANFEFRTVDDELVNDDRSFDIIIADVRGATAGTNNRLVVTIKDNDSNLYETLAGTWVFTGTASAVKVSNVKVSFSVKVATAAEGTEAFGNYLVCANEAGFDPDNDIPWQFSWRLKYEYNPGTQKVSLSIVAGEDVAANGVYTVRFRRVSLDGSTSELYRGEYNAETKAIEFENSNLVGDMYKDGIIQIQKFRLFGCKMERIR